MSIVPGVAVGSGSRQRAGVKHGVGRSAKVTSCETAVSEGRWPLLETFAGERLRGDLALLLSEFASLAAVLVRLVGEVDFCLFGDLVLALVAVIGDAG